MFLLLYGILHVFSRRTAVEILEHGAEACRIGETADVHYVGDALLAILQQLGCLLQSDVADEAVRSLVGQLLHLAMQVHSADAHLLGYHVYTQVGIADVLVNHLHHALHQCIIWSLNLPLFHLLLLTLFAQIGRAHV